MFQNLQGHLREDINLQSKQLEPDLNRLRERKAAKTNVLEIAFSKLTELVSNIEIHLHQCRWVVGRGTRALLAYEGIHDRLERSIFGEILLIGCQGEELRR